MFSGQPAGGDDARHQLLGRDNEEDHEEGWEQHALRSERNAESDSELWEQDPLSGDSHELNEPSNGELTPTSTHPPSTRSRRSRRAKPVPEDHGVAGTDLEAEFERIFSPVKTHPSKSWRD